MFIKISNHGNEIISQSQNIHFATQKHQTITVLTHQPTDQILGNVKMDTTTAIGNYFDNYYNI